MIYLAGPIDRVTHDQAAYWRKYAAKVLVAQVFDPFAAFGYRRNPVGGIKTLQDINLYALRKCKVLLANVEDACPASLTWHEIDIALDMGMTVVMYTGINGPPQAKKYTKPWIYNSLGDAIAAADREHNSHTMVVDDEDYRANMASLGQFVPMDELVAPEESKRLLFMHDPSLPSDYRPEPPIPVYDGDVGFDLPAAFDTVLQPGQTTQVQLSFRIATPPGYWWRLVGRSSTWRKLGLIVHEGIIDEGYRGPLYAGVHNPTGKVVHIERGDRLVQCIPQRVHALKSVLVDSLPESDRNENGFGSSGK